MCYSESHVAAAVKHGTLCIRLTALKISSFPPFFILSPGLPGGFRILIRGGKSRIKNTLTTWFLSF
jgi:hypothetical protein